jgi:two-component system response regulator PilR (NtrC family)
VSCNFFATNYQLQNGEKMNRVLVIDDEPDILELLSITIKRMGMSCVTADTIAKAKLELDKGEFQLCLTDMRLPDGSGLDLVAFISQNFSHLPVVMITAYGSMDMAIQAMKQGAFDFLSKPVDLEKLRSIVKNALLLHKAVQPSNTDDPFPNIIGNSEKLHLLKIQISKVACSHAPVFIHGESGSGKELVARGIHHAGPRSNEPFIAVNCGAITSELMESEFFGHKKGAFTGANNNKEGFFQAAHGGTLFLDEVADLPLVMQVKLLRAIQENTIRPVGSEKELSVDVRILSASHKDLQKEVGDKTFREDLFYRLDVINLQVPPLRERLTDVPILSAHILKKLSKSLGFGKTQLSPIALNALNTYHFPGNIRELENILQRAITLSDGDLINLEDLNLKRNVNNPAASNDLSLDGSVVTTIQKRRISDLPIKSSLRYELDPGETLEHYLENIEKQILTQTLEDCRWNKTAAAEKLGVSFRSIRYRLKKLNIE